jgi:ribosomal protein L37E
VDFVDKIKLAQDQSISIHLSGHQTTMALIECKQCGAHVSSKASSCPACGAPRKNINPLWWVFLGLGGLWLLVSSVISSRPSGGESTFDLAGACAKVRTLEYNALIEKKDFSGASEQMAACTTLADQPQYKKMQKAAELAHYEQELAASGGDKARKMNAVRQMLLGGHEVDYLLVSEFRRYEQAEDARIKAVEVKMRKSQGVTIGMTEEEVLASNWGKPKRINTTTRSSGVSAQWVYDGGGYLYFEDGVLRTIQN